MTLLDIPLLNAPIQMALDKIKDTQLNPAIKDYAVIQDISYQDKKLHLTLTLLGMEDVPLSASASKILIAEDGSTLQFDGFEANKPFLLNALNAYGKREFKMPDNPVIRKGLAMLRGMIS